MLRVIALCSSIIALLILSPVWADGSGRITIRIVELRNTEGQVLISLYNKAEGFPKDRDVVIRSKAVRPIEADEVEVAFEDLPHGDYAVAVLHDENFDGDMNYGFLHLPKEGYCISNNLRPKLRAPKFDQAKFTLDAENVTQILNMIY